MILLCMTESLQRLLTFSGDSKIIAWKSNFDKTAVSLNSGAGCFCLRPGFSASMVKNPGLLNGRY